MKMNIMIPGSKVRKSSASFRKNFCAWVPNIIEYSCECIVQLQYNYTAKKKHYK